MFDENKMQDNVSPESRETNTSTFSEEESSKASSAQKTSFFGGMKHQLTPRGIIIGLIGCVVITACSLYVALKMGALPWPIIFVAITSFFALKLFGSVNMNEVNVTHTIMSAGAMVAGGLAFTIPAVWILDPQAQVSWTSIAVATFCGVALGLVFTAGVRRYFVIKRNLPYPIAIATTETLLITKSGGAKAGALFGSMGIAGLFTALRDWLGLIPQMFLSKVAIPGVAFGIYASPMMLAVGYIIGPVAIAVWFVGALIGDFAIVCGAPFAGLCDLATAQGIKSSLGIGVMIGSGIGIVVKGLATSIKVRKRTTGETPAADSMPSSSRVKGGFVGLATLTMATVALVLSYLLGLGLVPSIICVVGAWLMVVMSAQLVGLSGINPMELFGLLVLLIVRIYITDSTFLLFLVALVVAIACGLAGDLLNDFKVGSSMGTSPGAQWIGQVIGGFVGGAVAVLVLYIFVGAYGSNTFGIGKEFIAAQASVIASMAGGVPSVSALVIGIVAGLALSFTPIPIMTLGLGIYLPFYLSFTAFIGMLVGVLIKKFAPVWEARWGQAVASGLLGGEAIVGVIIALVATLGGVGALW